MSATTKSTNKLLCQVLLSRPGEHGNHEDVFWIDSKLAIKGKKVQDEDGIVWFVKEIYSMRSFDNLDAQRQAWKTFSDKLNGH